MVWRVQAGKAGIEAGDWDWDQSSDNSRALQSGEADVESWVFKET